MLRVLRDRWRAAAGLSLFAVLAGCAGHFLAQREPWRKDAEIACLQSGAVKETGTIVRVEPINGPGMCGADYPFKVAAFGDTAALGYSGELRPPGSVPNAGPQRWPVGNGNFVPTPPPSRSDPRYAPPPSNEPQFANPARGTSVQASQRIDSRNDPFAVNSGSRAVAPGQRRTVHDEPADEEYQPYEPPQNGRRAPPPPPVRSAPAAAPLRAPVSVPLGRGAIAAVGPVEIKPPATLACPIVSALDRWITEAVQPAAQRWFRQPVASIKQISAYSCRGMNGQPGARISEHAFGNALDIASFTLADGRVITVKNGWRGSPEEQGFLRDVQGAACDSFNTVLAPGSNRFHYDHFHFDLMRRSSGNKICNPDQIPGEVVAARAARERGYALRPEPAATGSFGYSTARGRTASLNGKPAKAKARSKSRNILDDDDWIEDDGPRPE